MALAGEVVFLEKNRLAAKFYPTLPHKKIFKQRGWGEYPSLIPYMVSSIQ